MKAPMKTRITPTFPMAPVLRHDSASLRELTCEHGVLLRQLGRLQQRLSDVLSVHAQHQARLEQDNLRLRAELVLLRTSVVWGLGAAAVAPMPPAAGSPQRTALNASVREAHNVICQTGCVGHAHPWLEPDGQCRRSGQACERLAAASARTALPEAPGVKAASGSA